MALVGRRVELESMDSLLDRAADGGGGLLVVVGPAGSGKTALLAEAGRGGRSRGFQVAGGSAVAGAPGRLVWAQLLRDVGGPDAVAAALLGDPSPSDVDAAARWFAGGRSRLIVVDDVDRGGAESLELLTLLAGRLVLGSTAVVASTSSPLGIGPELRLKALSRAELAMVIDVGADVVDAVWVASAGLPGVARSLAAQLRELAAGSVPLVHLALHARSTARFLDVDVGLIRLLEAALDRAEGDVPRARVLARLARELLGDSSAGGRRRALADEALALARRAGDRQALAEVLDARLYALWDPAAAQDRLDAAGEITDLARAAGDAARERAGLFWRFVALMELGRVAEAESVLARFERAAAAAGDTEALIMVTARHAMLATLRGRFEDAGRLTDEVEERGRRVGLADTTALVGTLRGVVRMVREDRSAGPAGLSDLYDAARHLPGHLFEAPAARFLAMLGRLAEAAADLDRLLPLALNASGPRWVGAVADLSVVAVLTGNRQAATSLYEALLPYRGRLVVWGGANTVTGPAGHYLGLLATELGLPDDAVDLLSEAVALEERVGALPWLAASLVALADALICRQRDGDAERASQSRRRARLLAERVGLPGLLERLTPPADEWTLRPDGDGWLLEAGEERARLPDGRGLNQLSALLRAPRVDIPALDLAAGGAGLVAPSSVPMLDRDAVAAYRDRLTALDADLDAADRTGDSERAAGAEQERAMLFAELRRAQGLGGRMRATSAEAERARVNVTRTLRATIDRLADTAPRAAAHLRASVRTGLCCRYDPAPGGPTRWHA